MKNVLLGLATSTMLMSGMVEAASYTVSSNSSFLPTEVDETIHVDGFDDKGGTRQLTRVDFEIWTEFYGDVYASGLTGTNDNATAGLRVLLTLNSTMLGLNDETIFLANDASLLNRGEPFDVGVDDGLELHGSISSDLGIFSSSSIVPLSFTTQTEAYCRNCTVDSYSASAGAFLDVTYNYENTVATVPLPASLPLLLSGLGGIAAFRFRRKKRTFWPA